VRARAQHVEHVLLGERGAAGIPLLGQLFAWTRGRLQAADLIEGSLGRAIFEAAERGDVSMESRSILTEQIIVAGMETTITSLCNAVILLGQHPDQYRALRQNPSLIPSALAEVLRLAPALPLVGRLVAEDIEIGGTVIPAGAQVALLLSAGNRDPRRYDDPERFDITRNAVDHLSFGYGTHACAGQGLSRLELQAMLSAMIAQIESFGVGEVVERINNIGRPYDRIDVIDVVPVGR